MLVIYDGMTEQMTRTVLEKAVHKLKDWKMLELPEKKWEPGSATTIRALIDDRGIEHLNITRNRKGTIKVKWIPSPELREYWLLSSSKRAMKEERKLYRANGIDEHIPIEHNMAVTDETVIRIGRAMLRGLLREETMRAGLEYHSPREVQCADLGYIEGQTWFMELTSRVIEKFLCHPENQEETDLWNHHLERDQCHCQFATHKRRTGCECHCPQCHDIRMKYGGSSFETQGGTWPEGTWHDDWEHQDEEYDWYEDGREDYHDPDVHRGFGDAPPPRPYPVGWEPRPQQTEEGHQAQNGHPSADERNGRTDTVSTGGKTPDLITLASTINEAIRDYLVSKEALEVTIRLTQGGKTKAGGESQLAKTDTLKYESVERHLSAYQGLLQSAPGLASFHYTHAPRDLKRPMKHPGQLVRRIRRTTKLTGHAWKIFCKLTNPESDETQILFQSPKQTQKICSGIAEANRPQAPAEMLYRAARTDWNADRIGHNRKRASLHRENWRRMLSSYLKDREGRRDQETLNHVADAVIGYSQENQTWGPGEWNAMVRRAERWHRETARRGTSRAQWPKEWQSEVGTLQVEEYQATPATTATMVLEAAERMQNCLETYIPALGTGRNQLFILSKPGTPPTAVMLERGRSGWRVSEAENADFRRPQQETMQAAERLAEIYTRAEREGKAEKQRQNTDG